MRVSFPAARVGSVLRLPVDPSTALARRPTYAMRVRASPTIYESNTAAWLQRLGRRIGRAVGLGDVPGSEWDALAALPVDAIWPMGVWQRSPIGRTVALATRELLAACRAALPDLREDNVLGSPYCVRDYVVEERFEGPRGMAAVRQQTR